MADIACICGIIFFLQSPNSVLTFLLGEPLRCSRKVWEDKRSDTREADGHDTFYQEQPLPRWQIAAMLEMSYNLSSDKPTDSSRHK